MGKRIYYNKPKRLDTLTPDEQLDMLFDLINAFRIVRKPTESALLMQDLLTATEIRNLAKRLRIAKMLLANETQRDITKKLNCSLSTVTKVNYWLNEGGDGFKNVISKLPKRYTRPRHFPKGPIEYHLPQTMAALMKHSLAENQSKKLQEYSRNIDSKRVADKKLQQSVNEDFRKNRQRTKSTT